ncbi:MAG TPA: divalent metal cation transporter [Acidocella sp.]|jgi:Mn2+/Fe2+ NRAMP family transporter|uniref:NRAMP family divalent metal transporter n=1 Tax=Acidocella sp. TaxID=50710 RepID=UPI002C20A631|nr:divalent metal cation transporter [Acidocella sp.]HVE21123.1 divalent metal cation transporter [Acidocella sp.]
MSSPTTNSATIAARSKWRRRMSFLAVFGPGLVVMLADSDVGSIVTAGQSGVQWGYKLLFLQALLTPVLYIVQELTVRLGVFTGRGHGELIREAFGPGWAWLSAAGLAVATIGALLTEFSGVAGIGDLYGVPHAVSLPLAVAALLAVVLTGSYRRAERAALVLGLFELVFFFVAWAARPDLAQMARESVQVPLFNANFEYLVAANIGAVIMPWMIFYQQSAIADKKLTLADYKLARWDTAIGAVITQAVMAAVLVAAAASIRPHAPQASLSTVGQMSQAMTPYLGARAGKLVFGLGVLGAGMVAAIVASLALAWGIGEVAGRKRSLEHHPLQAKWFYGVYTMCVVGGAALVGFYPDLISLNVGVQVLNALLLPLVLGFLVRLAMVTLPEAQRLKGTYLVVVLVIAVITCAFGVLGGVGGLIWP